MLGWLIVSIALENQKFFSLKRTLHALQYQKFSIGNKTAESTSIY